MDLSELGRWLVGGALGLGRLPGDLSFGGERPRVHVPPATSLVVSVGPVVQAVSRAHRAAPLC